MGSLQDLGKGRWKVTVSLGRDDQGRQRRVARRFTAAGKRDAKRLADRLEDRLRDEADRVAAGTFAEVAERWWELWRRRDRSPRTRESYRTILDKHLHGSDLAAKPVTELTVADFDRWYLELTDQVSATTVRRIHAVVVQVLDQCEREGTLARNPAALAHKPEVRSARRPHTSTAQVRQILSKAEVRSPTQARALGFAAMTGLRRGEMTALRWSRIDLGSGVAFVEFASIAVEGRFVGAPGASDGRRREVVNKDPKAHQAAAIALGDPAVELVRQQMEWQRSEAAYQMVDMAGDPFLWQVRPPFDRALYPDTLSHWMTGARKAAGQKTVRLHDLRHYQASALLEVGASVADVQERLRHRSIQTTHQYLEADTSKQKVLVALLPDLQLPLGP